MTKPFFVGRTEIKDTGNRINRRRVRVMDLKAARNPSYDPAATGILDHLQMAGYYSMWAIFGSTYPHFIFGKG